MRHLALFFLITFWAVPLCAAPAPQPDELYRSLNAFRAAPSCGSPVEVLQAGAVLEEAARLRASGLPLGEALDQAGYVAPYAKVLVVGGATVRQVMERLQQRHCAELTDAGFRQVGAAWVKNRWWIVLGYGQRQTVPPEAVQRVAPQTDARPVAVTPENLLALVNQARSTARSCGGKQYDAAPPLFLNNSLQAAAKAHAADMAARNQLSHTGSDGSQVSDRVQRQGYNYRRVGENVAMNPFGAQSAMESWLQSPGHCDNIMNPDYTELGAAFEGVYGVLVFGRR